MRHRRPTGNHLARILIARGWNVRTSLAPKGTEKFWDFRRAGSLLIPLNPKAEAVMRDLEYRWRDPTWPPDYS
jgi:hypothetical protein